MQLIYSHLKRTRYILIAVLILGFLSLWQPVRAQYGSDAYGACAYGEACPEDPIIKEKPPVVTPNETTPQSAQSEPKITEDSPRVVQKGAPAHWFARIFSRLSPSNQTLLPYYLWILLLILAIILLIQAYIDRHRVTKLIKQVESLEAVIHERKNFLRLVSHYLNTPLTAIKGGLELMTSTSTVDSAVLQPLHAAALELTAVGQQAQADAALETSSTQQADTSPPGLGSILGKWYCFIPIIVALLLGLGINYLLVHTNTVQPAHAAIYQVAVAIMSILIFVNAARMFTLGRTHKKMLNVLANSIAELNKKRELVLLELSQSLHSLVTRFKQGLEGLAGEKSAKYIAGGVLALADVSTKTRAATGWLSPDVQEVNVRDLMQSAVNKYQAEADNRSITSNIQYNIEGSVATHTNDLSFIMENLVSNAFAYSKDKGEVVLEVAEFKNQLRITVRDNGVGMTHRQVEELFHPFAKVGDVLTFDHSGIGLGLYASKQAAERLGGDITVTSKKDVGTEFVAALPMQV